MPQLKILQAATKTQGSQINVYIFNSRAGWKGSPPRNGKRGPTEVLALKAGKHPDILLCET